MDQILDALAEQIKERQSNWAYSKPIVILLLVWNFAFIIISGSVLIMSRHETSSMSLRLWITGNALQCVLHIVYVWAKYRKNYPLRESEWSDTGHIRYCQNYLSWRSRNYLKLLPHPLTLMDLHLGGVKLQTT